MSKMTVGSQSVAPLPPMSGDIGLQSLLNEPQRLAAEADKLNIELESLVMDNYKVFVENLTCSKHLRAEDKRLADVSGSLGKNLTDLSQQCFAFKDRVNQFVSNHKRNRKTLQHHMQLVELLEVPQLVDACARNGFHDEALELANFVNGLERRHLLASEVKSLNGKIRGGSGVIQNIVDEVHTTLASLRQQLLQQLTENVSLPQEIRILATLRKLDSRLIDRHMSLERHDATRIMNDTERNELRAKYVRNSEVRLQMDFLEARTIWLHRTAEGTLLNMNKSSHKSSDTAISMSDGTAADSGIAQSTPGAIATIDKGFLGPYGKAIEMLEMRRTVWFAVITQFNALFQDGNGGNPDKQENDRHNEACGVFSIESFSTNAVLNAWATRQVNQLLRELQQLLPRVDDGASLRSILEQTIYFASRMSQVGCDFSGLVVPLFQEVMLRRFRSEMKKAVDNFEVMLVTEKITFDSGTGVLAKDQVIPLYSSQDFTSNTSGEASKGDDRTRQATELPSPQLLMRFPPLAYLVNELLTNLNFIRECPIAAVELPALTLLFGTFSTICTYLVEKSSTVRNIGAKYISDPFLRDMSQPKSTRKGQSSAVKGSTASDSQEISMDAFYAQALALELMPHVLVCFDAIFQKTSSKVEARASALKAKNAVRAASLTSRSSDSNSTPATSSNSRNSLMLPCLIKNLSEAKDFMDADLVTQLGNAWSPLVAAGLLDKKVLVAEYIPTTSSSTKPSAAPPGTTKVMAMNMPELADEQGEETASDCSPPKTTAESDVRPSVSRDYTEQPATSTVEESVSIPAQGKEKGDDGWDEDF